MSRRNKGPVFEIQDEVLNSMEVLDASSILHRPLEDAGTQALVSSFKSSIAEFVSANSESLENPSSNPDRVHKLCVAMHSSQGVFDLVASQSGADLRRSCSRIINHMAVLETARNLTNKFI